VEKAITTHKGGQFMTYFLMFYAPFIVLFLAIGVAFFVALKDGAVRRQIEEEK